MISKTFSIEIRNMNYICRPQLSHNVIRLCHSFALICIWYIFLYFRSVVLGMGDGSMTTLTIADPDKAGISDFLKSLPSRNPEKADGIRTSRASSVYLQNGVEYPSPYDYSIYTDYLKALQQCIPPAHNTTNETES